MYGNKLISENSPFEMYSQEDIGGKGSSLELNLNKDVPFQGKSELEISLKNESNNYSTELDKAGIICVFYICKLPFVKC